MSHRGFIRNQLQLHELVPVHLPEKDPRIQADELPVVNNSKAKMTVFGSPNPDAGSLGVLLAAVKGGVFGNGQVRHVTTGQNPYRAVLPTTDPAPAVVVVSHRR